ncbi:MAG: hypothetical protein NZ890_13185 [Myxococcota bacterium]|nr:hypothetical protein [Myxococcota bacterium]
MSTPPPGGALAALGTRLGLSSVAQKVVALLYALEHLTGSHPGGLPPIEIAQALGPIHDEALVLGELLPEAPLRRQGVLRRAPGGRLRLSTAATALLAGQHLPDLIPGTSPRPGGHRLEPGLYHLPQHAAPALASLVSTLSQPTLRVDALAEADVLCALRRALRSARLHAAVVLVEGLPGVAYPLFGGEMRGPLLRRLLRAPEVPLVVCGSTTALSSLGLAAQTLTAPLPRGAPAPSLPSGALPPGTFWRAPLPSARAAFLDGSSAPPGRLELFDGTDPRAAIVLTGTATPDDFARAAALAARDGAVLVLDCPLTASRSMVLAALVRQVPVTVLIAPPPEGLPSELARLSEEFARGEGLL